MYLNFNIFLIFSFDYQMKKWRKWGISILYREITKSPTFATFLNKEICEKFTMGFFDPNFLNTIFNLNNRAYNSRFRFNGFSNNTSNRWFGNR